jgi:transposase-like protein
MEKQPKTLQQAIKYFSDEQTCIDTVASLRWPDGKPTCPACEHKDHYYLKTQKRWKCKECGRQFSVKLGTIFEDSALGLDKWLIALWMLVNCKNGVSSYEVSRDLGISQKSAWFMLHRLRLALQRGSMTKLGGKNGGAVEVDETFVGGRIANMHKSKKAKLTAIKGRALAGDHMNKTVVMGMLDRDLREVRAKVIPNVRRETLQGEVLQEVSPNSKVYTDAWIGYKSLKEREFVHEIVDHVESYVNGHVHTNGIENFWSLLKRTLKGTYVAVEPFHLQRYVDEQVFRFNNRKDESGKKLKDADRFNAALSQIAGKRLTFAEVTGKVGQAATF